MSLKTLLHKPYGLRRRFTLALILAGIFCTGLFFSIYYATEMLLNDYFEESDFESRNIQKQGKNLQKYIMENEISSRDLSELKEWERKQPIILLELYRGDECIYNSFNEKDQPLENHLMSYENGGEYENVVEIALMDCKVNAVFYSDFSYQYYMIRTVLVFLFSFLVFIFLFLHSSGKVIRYICRLNDEVQILEGGNLDYQVSVQGNDEITDLARSMNSMKTSFQEQMEKEQKIYQAHKSLVTEMSHDLRTPLTGIMLYLEILRTHHYETEEELQDYLEKVDAKAHHLKQLSDHLFEYSLEGLPEKQNEPKSMQQSLAKPLQSFIDDLKVHGYPVHFQPDWLSCFLQVKEEYMCRIFENILSNILKYADRETGVVIETIANESHSGLLILNACNDQEEEGTVESNGIGIESIRSMMGQMNGICIVERTERVFEIVLLFPKQ